MHALAWKVRAATFDRHEAAATHFAVIWRECSCWLQGLTSHKLQPLAGAQHGLEAAMQSAEQAGKVANLALLVVSMSPTGSGDAFARLKVPMLSRLHPCVCLSYNMKA